MDKQQFKAATASAQTWADGEELMAQLSHELLVEYVTTLKAVQEFTDLTMRDEFMLRFAESRLSRQDAMEGNIIDTPPPLKVRLQMLLKQFRDDEEENGDEDTDLREIIDEIEFLVNND